LLIFEHKQLGLFDTIRVFCVAQSDNLTPPLYSNVIRIYLLAIRYPVGYPGNEMPDSGSPIDVSSMPA